MGASVGQVDLIIFVVSITALVLVELFIRKSLMGVNVQKLILLVFLIAGSLAGLAGALLGAKYTAFPTLGTAMTNKAFISSVFGGLGSIPRRGAGGDHAGDRRDHDFQLYFLLHARHFRLRAAGDRAVRPPVGADGKSHGGQGMREVRR